MVPTPPAREIDCASSTCIGGTRIDGTRWQMAPAELIQAIESGAITCYVTLEGHAHLVMVKPEPGRPKSLVTLVGDLAALPLRPCR